MLRVCVIFLAGLAVGAVTTLAFRARSGSGALSTPADGPAKSRPGGNDAGKPGSIGRLSPRQAVAAIGTIEPREGIVQISSPLVGFQIQHIHVKEGQPVQAGDLLIELDSAAAEVEHELAIAQRAEALDRQQAEIAVAKERKATAELALQQAVSGRELELQSKNSQVLVAAAKEKQAQKDADRLKELRKLPEPLSTAQQIEHQQLALEAATAELGAATSALERLKQSLDFQQQTAAAELRAAQQSLALAENGRGIESLNRRVELAALKLKQTKVTAPAAGVVLALLAHPGEVVVQQPLAQIADLDNLVCAVEVEAGDVPYLHPDHAASIRCRAFQDAELTGTVERVGNQVSQATLRPLDPRTTVDRAVTKVMVRVDAKDAERLINLSGNDCRAALVGLQVDVSFPLATHGQ